MGKKKEETTSTAVAVTTENVLSQFFQVDFNSMNTVIEKLATRGDLSKVEKKEANEIIDTWNNNVIDKLSIEENNINSFVNALTGNTNNGISAMIQNQTFITELEMLVEVAGMQAEYQELCDTVDEYMMAENARRLITRPDETLNTTNGERIIAAREYEYECTKATMELNRIGNKIIRLNSKFSTTLLANADVKNLITKLKRRATSMKKMKAECTDKAQLAKINITIDDVGVRDTLKELINLTKF